jgi:hypothetical protein
MAVVRACRMSRTTFDAGCERLEELRILAENIPSDIGPSAQGAGEVAHLKMGNQYQPMHEMRLKAWWFQWVRTAKTKGNKWTGKEIERGDGSSSLRKYKKGTRQCKKCGMYVGHYSTTCPLNRDAAARGSGGHRGRWGTMGTKRGKPPINRQLELEFTEAASEENIDEEMYEKEN